MKKNKAITLFELIIVLAIISIMAIFSIPKFKNIRETMRLKAAARQFYQDFYWTKLKAMEKGICHTIILDCNSYDYCIIEDPNCNGTGNTYLSKVKFSEKFKGVNKITGSGNIIFQRTGFLQGLSNKTITLQNSSGQKLDVVISRLGRIRIGDIY